ncbi:MAG: hypothetical protein AB1449_09195 [Chloroflexota bacterium]
MNRPGTRRLTRPIGVLTALATGFDRIAARPWLLLPPIALDLFLWLGPALRVSSLVRAISVGLVAPPGADASMLEQARLLRQVMADVGQHFNLFAALSSLPVGVPSLMAGRMPLANPMGTQPAVELSDPVTVLTTWGGLTLLGLGLGSIYHLWAARQVAPRAEVPRTGRVWLRIVLLAIAAWIAAFVLLTATLVAVTFVTLLLPNQTWLGMLLAFAGFSLLFWVGVYLVFSPHGIVRYGLGVLRSVRESVQVVRWNLLGTTVFVGLAIGLTWLTNWVWSLPEESSWYSLLAVLGHAFVSAMLLVGSYAFYQGRREWTLRLRGVMSPPADETMQPPQPDA